MVLPLMSEDIIHNNPSTYASVTLHIWGGTLALLYVTVVTIHGTEHTLTV